MTQFCLTINSLIVPLFTKNRYADKERQEQLIRQWDFDWTIVRPAPFSDAKPRSDFQVLTEVGSVVLRKVSHSEVASFVIQELERGDHVRETVFIGHNR
jgi:putative NADH-flavin reductase